MINLIMRMCFISGVFVLSGCVAGPYGGGVAFVNPFSAMSDSQPESEKKKQQPEVYGPPQIIYRIDKDRYFTLEQYTRCENGKTFYNNKAKGIHTQISPSSGYLFKGRLFWLSTRDDYLAFPLTANNNKAACMGSDKGCLNTVAVTTDGGKTLRSVTYGSNTQDPNGDTKDYDMLVTNDSFYLIYYRGKGRVYPVVDRWDLDKENWLGVVKSEDEYSLLRPGEEKPVGGFFKIDMSKFYPKKGEGEMQCDRQLESVQPTGRISDE
ncbi:T6SS immunity protein Tli3 family protein [Raoultella terrigena]|uniref:T6SS immunity protein Tli3 family protein n=1 Tax=Raoultella terrigena TaxID=577 RepID=UPI000F4BD809|nr:hypothetical protein [Raoultella terrigena]ROS06057.1 hypothetical protein EDF76_0043 [Raoultella terrigena]